MSLAPIAPSVQATPLLALQRAQTLDGIHNATCRHCCSCGCGKRCAYGYDLHERVLKLEARANG